MASHKQQTNNQQTTKTSSSNQKTTSQEQPIHQPTNQTAKQSTNQTTKQTNVLELSSPSHVAQHRTNKVVRVLPTKASSWDLNPRAEATVGRRDAPPYCPWICVLLMRCCWRELPSFFLEFEKHGECQTNH